MRRKRQLGQRGAVLGEFQGGVRACGPVKPQRYADRDIDLRECEMRTIAIALSCVGARPQDVLRAAGLLRTDLGNIVATFFDLVGNSVYKGCALVPGGIPIGPECIFRRLSC